MPSNMIIDWFSHYFVDYLHQDSFLAAFPEKLQVYGTDEKNPAHDVSNQGKI